MRRLLIAALALAAFPTIAGSSSASTPAETRRIPTHGTWKRWHHDGPTSSRTAANGPFTGSALAPSPPIAEGFQALDDNLAFDAVPPDTNGAVGPNHLMVTLNTDVMISDRAGTQISKQTIDAFWAPLGGSPFAFDPHIIFDTLSQRWVFIAVANPDEANSQTMIAISNTSDPTGTWKRFEIDADSTNNIWADYPSVGISKDLVVVQVNQFCRSTSIDCGTASNGTPFSPGDFVRGDIYAIKKANLIAGALSFQRFPDPDAFTTQPTVNHDTSSTIYLVQDWDGRPTSGGGGQLRIGRVTWNGTSAAYDASTPFTATAANWREDPMNAPQSGGPGIDAGDGRMQGCSLRNGSIWCAQTVFVPASSPTHSAVQWWQLNPNHAVIQRGLLDGTTAEWYAYPNIGVNANNDVLIGYSAFSSTTFASAHYASRLASDAPGTLRDDTVLKAGEASYNKTLSGTANRWGDYSATSVDPLNDADFWTIQEYADLPYTGASPPVDRWATWWGHVASASYATPADVDKSIAVKFTGATNVTSDNITLKDGTTPVPNTLSCASRSGAPVDCATGPVWTAKLAPSALLIPGVTYVIAVNPVGAPSTIKVNGVDIVASPKPFRFSTIEDASPAAHQTWRVVVTSPAIGGSYHEDRLSGGHVTFAFTGTAITWYTVNGPDHGIASVKIDGVRKPDIDTYAAAVGYSKAHAYTVLAGNHVIEIGVTGSKNSQATDYEVAVDAFKVGTTMFASPSAAHFWRARANSSASGGRYICDDLSRAWVSTVFRGTKVSWYTIFGPNQGKASVYIDGTLKGTYDTYSASTLYGKHFDFTEPSNAMHTFKIVITGQKNASSHGTYVFFDKLTFP